MMSMPQQPLPLVPSLSGVSAGMMDDDDDDGSPHANKKFKHNVAERRRTSRLNALFDEVSASDR